MSYKVVKHVEMLIDHGRGDSGRLRYILDKLKQNKPLFSSDQKYLEFMIKKYPMVRPDEASMIKETFRARELNDELKTELKFAYEEIERLEAQIIHLKKEKMTAEHQQAPGQLLLDTKNATVQTLEAQEAPSISATTAATMVEVKLTVDDIAKYAKESSAARTKGGMFSKEKIVEVPLAWEKFLYPYYDVEAEITLKELEKIGNGYEPITKSMKSKLTIDGRTGALVDVTGDGISYRYSFLKDLSTEEIALLYYSLQANSFSANDLSGLGISVEKSIIVAEKLAAKNYLKRESGRTIKYQLQKELQIPNPTKLKSISAELDTIEATTNDRKIKPSVTSSSIPLQLAKYWSRCHVPSSTLVYYPFYGITYDRKDYYRIEIVDGVTGKRQDYLEHFVTIRPQNKMQLSSQQQA